MTALPRETTLMRQLLTTLVVAGTLLVGATTAAAQGDLAPPPGRVWTVFTTVDAAIDDNYAIIKVIADIGNRGPDPEFPFQVLVPGDAFVSGLTVERDGEVFEAKIEDRQKARDTYEEWKAQQQTGGLVEKQRGTQLYSFLINVAEFTSVRATLTYEVYIAAEEGIYSLPLQAPVSGFGQDLGARFTVLIRHSDGVVGAFGSPDAAIIDEKEGVRLEYSVGPRPDDASTLFTASYILNPTDEAGSIVVEIEDGVGYFVHRFRAPPEATELPLDLVLVLDTSGSMAGLKMSQLKDAATQVLTMLRGEDRFHIVLFSSDARSLWSGLEDATPAQRALAGEEIAAALAAGGTNIASGLDQGLDAFDGVDWSDEEGRMPILVFLTDGQPTIGETDRERLRDEARDANAHGVSVFALAFGSDADWGLMHGFAEDGGGVALRVPEGEGAEVDLRRFIAALTTPVLKDVVIAYDDDSVQARRRTAPILFAGSELLVVGTFDKDLDGICGTVTGKAPDGPREYSFCQDVGSAPGGSFLPRLVAYHEIRHFQDLIDAEGEKDEWVATVTESALAHGFVTDYTSLVVTLDPRSPSPVMLWDAEASMTSDEASSGADRSGAPASGAPANWSGSTVQTRRDTSSGSDTGSHDAAGNADDADALMEQEGGTPGLATVAALLALAAVALVASRRRR